MGMVPVLCYHCHLVCVPSLHSFDFYEIIFILVAKDLEEKRKRKPNLLKNENENKQREQENQEIESKRIRRTRKENKRTK